jgi:serine/threonine protein kinase
MFLVAAAPTDEAPRKLGRFLLARELWTGAWSSIWMAADTGADHAKVTIRRVHATHLREPATRAKLLEAARAGVKLSHPNVLAGLEVIEEGGAVAIVSPPFEGQPLSEILRGASSHGVTIPLPVAIRIALELLAALETAHGASDDPAWAEPITPLDLTPENVLVTESGETKLIDLTLERAALGLTSPISDSVLGHRAPERFDGAGSRRSDLFSVAVLVWEMLASKALFSGTDVEQAVKRREIPRLDAPGVRAQPTPPKLAVVMAQALDRTVARRIATADHLGQALMSAAGAVASPAEVGELVKRVTRARALQAPTAKRPELLQTPMVGTVISPLARMSEPPPEPTKTAAPAPAAKAATPKAPPVAGPAPAAAKMGKPVGRIGLPPAPPVPRAPLPSAPKAPPKAGAPAPRAPSPVLDDEVDVDLSPAEPPPGPKPAPAPPPEGVRTVRMNVVPAAVMAEASPPAAPAPAPLVAPAPAVATPPASPPLALAPPAPPAASVAPSPAVVPAPFFAASPSANDAPFMTAPPPIAPATSAPVGTPGAEPSPIVLDDVAAPRPRPLWQRPAVIGGGLALAVAVWIAVLVARSGAPAPSAAKTPPATTTTAASPNTPPPPAAPPQGPTAASDPVPPSDAPPSTEGGSVASPGGVVGGGPRPAGDSTPAPSASEAKPVPPKRRYNPKSI